MTHHNPPFQSLAVNGTMLAYRECGAGLPLLLVHGSVADASSFDRVQHRLAADHRVLVYSRRFHPPNPPPRPGEEYDTGQQVADLLALLRLRAQEPALVVGSSFGGSIALLACLRAPESFRALILSEPPMVPLLEYHPEGAEAREQFMDGVMARAAGEFVKGNDAEGLGIFLDGVRGEAGWFAHASEAVRREFLRFVPEMKAEILAPENRYMLPVSLADLHGMRIPTLLIGGERSTPMFRMILDVLHHNLPRVHRVLIAGAGHLPHVQRPAAWESVVREFLKTLS